MAEMGARRAGDVDAAVPDRAPDVVVVTNVGVAHLEIFGSWERIVEASAEPVDALGPDGVAVLNADDPVVAGYARPRAGARRHVRRVCIGRGARRRRRPWIRDGRASFTLVHGGGARRRCRSPSPGSTWCRTRSPPPAVGRVVRGAARRRPPPRCGAATVSHWRMETFTTPNGRARRERRLQREPRVRGGRAEGGALDGGPGSSDRGAGHDGGAGPDLDAGARARRRAGGASPRGPPDHGGTRGAPHRDRRRARRRRARQRRGLRRPPTRRWTTSAGRREPGDVVLFKGSRVAGLEKLAEALR